MSKYNEQKYFVVDSKYIAHAINIMTGIKFYQFTNEDIKLMVEMVLDRIKGKENDLADITPDMILSDDGTIA